MAAPGSDRLAREAAHFDAATDAPAVLARDLTLDEHVRCFLAPERFTARAFEVLGHCDRMRCLDLGGGGGSAALVLAARGGRVTVCDVSGRALALARAQAARFGVAHRVQAARADALRLPVPDGAFERVLGLGILHHLPDLAAAGREVRRVLAPGGRAVFTEPLAGNPLLGLARAFVPYRKKHRTSDERPLSRAGIQAFLRAAGGGMAEAFDLTAMVRRLLRNTGRPRPTVRALEAVDRWLFAICPPLRRWARYALISVPGASPGDLSGARLTEVRLTALS